MRKTRIFALLCAVVLMIGMVSVATAQTVLPATGVVERAMGWHNNLLLKNKKTATIYVWPDWTSYPFDKDGFDVDAILYDCKGAVTGKSNVDWLTTKPIPRGFAIEEIPLNKTLKNRTGKITVKGKNYKATVKITQFGADKLLSATRKKNKVTVNYQLGDAPLHAYSIYRYELQADGTVDYDTYESVKSGKLTGKKLTFKVEKGYRYHFAMGPAFKSKYYYDGYTWSDCAYVEFRVNSVTGSETLTGIWNFAE